SNTPLRIGPIGTTHTPLPFQDRDIQESPMSLQLGVGLRRFERRHPGPIVLQWRG
ncbi:hypothetical protein A2U01_0113850, partial [Trifolium medium]|nr:hypothetical protein [Trifolium medium]